MSHSTESNILDTLPDSLKDWVQAHVDAGAYDSAADFVRAVLEHRKAYEDKVEALRAALIEGEQSGDAGPLDMDDIRRRARAQVGLAPPDA